MLPAPARPPRRFLPAKLLAGDLSPTLLPNALPSPPSLPPSLPPSSHQLDRACFCFLRIPHQRGWEGGTVGGQSLEAFPQHSLSESAITLIYRLHHRLHHHQCVGSISAAFRGSRGLCPCLQPCGLDISPSAAGEVVIQRTKSSPTSSSDFVHVDI